LFGITADTGRTDPADRCARTDLATRVDDLVALLVSHAHHEDTFVQPAIEQYMPALATKIASDHEVLEARMVDLQTFAGRAVDARDTSCRTAVRRLYLELASFTSAYLAHQDVEERLVMPELERAIGVDGVLALHQSIVASIPPAEMASSLALMLPAMNIDDRSELLGGIQAGAPVEVFEGVWGLAASVLPAADHQALGVRLGVR
jgi:hemerythrin HHE cation binding domain-containing protein